VVNDTVRLTTRLTRTLKHDFPHGLHWLQDQDTALCCDFLRRWPTLTAVPLARRATLATCFRDHHVHSADVIAQRLPAITAATPLTTDDGITTPTALVGQARIAQLRVTLQALAAVDPAITQQAQRHPDFPRFQALPGAGPVVASRLLVAVGAHRDRYPSAAALHKYAGIAPVTARRGKNAWVHWRLQCPKCLRQTFVEGAAESIRHAFWAPVDDQQQRAKGKAHQAAVRALACKGMRILYRCGPECTPSDESTSRQALKRRGASLIQNLAQGS
jgi:hypothetical protein